MTTKKSGCGCLSTITMFSALLIAGGYGLSQGWHQFIWGTELTPLEAAKIMPQETFITSYIHTDPKNWSASKVREVDSLVNHLSQKFTQYLPQPYQDLNYTKDLSPWLGNAAIAFFPKATPSLNNSYGLQPDADFLLILGIKNPLQAYRFRKAIKAEGKVRYQESKFQGVKITTINQSPPSKVYLAVLRNKLVITEKLSIMHQAIATFNGEPALADDPQSREVFQQKLSLSNPLVQVYLTNYQRLLGETFPVDSVTLGIGNEAQAIRLKTIANFNHNIAEEIPKKEQESILENFPESTIALISGQINASEIKHTWSYFIEDYYPYLSWFIDSEYNLSQWLIAISNYQDFFQLIDGEFGLGITLSDSSNKELNFSAGLILTMSDRQQADLAFEQLQHKSLVDLLIPGSNLGGQPNSSNFSLDSSWLDEDNLLLSWNDNRADSKFEQPQNSLLQNHNFSRFYKDLPRNNLGYFYLDVDAIMSQINQLNELKDSESEISILNSIKSISHSSVLKQRNKTLESDTLLRFK